MKNLVEMLQESLASNNIIESSSPLKNIMKEIRKNREIKSLLGDDSSEMLIDTCIDYLTRFYEDAFVELSSDDQAETILSLYNLVVGDYEDVEDAAENCTVHDIVEIVDASGLEDELPVLYAKVVELDS